MRENGSLPLSLPLCLGKRAEKNAYSFIIKALEFFFLLESIRVKVLVL